MKHVRAKPIKTPIGEILPSLGTGDKLKDGREINASSLFLLMHGGTAKLKHEGKNVEIDVGSTCGVGGMSLVLGVKGGRQFKTDIEAIINHAIEHGLLDPALRFEEATGKDK